MPTAAWFRAVAAGGVILLAGAACVTPRRVRDMGDAGTTALPAPHAAVSVDSAPLTPQGSKTSGAGPALGLGGALLPVIAAEGGTAAGADTALAGRAAVALRSADSGGVVTEIVSDAPLAADSIGLVAAGATPVWDIEVEAHASRARVAYFVDAFTGRLHTAFGKALSRQTQYDALISDRLRAAGLPQDLNYLALIESWYDPHAYSRAAAVGMWQFMTRTAKGVGLRVDWWIDERRDPVRATEGAVRLLASLHDEFGSLFLAAAAYNGGSGRVTRGLAQFARRMEGVEGDDRYFALSETRYLRPETRDYVPKIIAAALVARQPERYGFTVDSLPPLSFDTVRVAGGTPLAAIAAAAAAPLSDVRDLNPHVLRGMLPEGDSLWVRVPVGSAVAFDSAFATLDSATRHALTRLRSKSGQSMVSIARSHGMTSKQLGWYNPKVARLKSGNLVAGQAIAIPSRDVLRAARDVPNPAIERYPARARSRAAVRPAAPPAKAAKPPTRQ